MRLAVLATEIDGARVMGDDSVEIAGLAYDSRRAGPGTLFFCVPGEKADGHDFAAAAVEAGAIGLVVDRELDVDVAQVVVADVRAAMAPLAARFHGDPTAELRVIGVTGTNGKTTTAFLIREVLQAAGMQCGLLGTVKQVVGGAEEGVERTTPEAVDLQATFRRMRQGGDVACVMEVSSHALELRRCDAIHWEVALFTNLTQDHLDFHGDMEAYYRSKRLLFEQGPDVSIANAGDPYGRRLAKEFRCATFAIEDRPGGSVGPGVDYLARGVSFDAVGSSFAVDVPPAPRRSAEPGGVSIARSVEVRTALPGHFNVENALAALAAGMELGVPMHAIVEGLGRAGRVPGRFEPVDEGQTFAVFVDYAHTPDSLANVLRAARRVTEGRLISVFGAGGDRDRDKRPKMGRAAAELSDLTIVTSDNPRSEDPGEIVADILAGIGRGEEVEVEVDRRNAIALALSRARPGDTVVIAGKGHERGQEFENGRREPFDDREVAREELRQLWR